MTSIFTLDNVDNFTEKINIDELYTRKKNHDLNQKKLFDKILNRIHTRIKLTSKQKLNEQFTWFIVPEVILGVPKYDQASCIAYLIDNLKENGFYVKYYDPNTLHISWAHWVPQYVRTEIKNKTGIIMDEYGSTILPEEDEYDDTNSNNFFMKKNNTNANTNIHTNTNNKKKNYPSVQNYRPLGKLF